MCEDPKDLKFTSKTARTQDTPKFHIPNEEAAKHPPTCPEVLVLYKRGRKNSSWAVTSYVPGIV